jgi:hypothetical protein
MDKLAGEIKVKHPRFNQGLFMRVAMPIRNAERVKAARKSAGYDNRTTGGYEDRAKDDS